MLKRALLIIGIALLFIPHKGYAFSYAELRNGFCDRSSPDAQDALVRQQLSRQSPPGTDRWSKYRSIYATQYCDLEKSMEKDVLERVSKQLSEPSFFGTKVSVGLLKGIIHGGKNVPGFDSKQLPEAIRKKYFSDSNSNTSESQSAFFGLIKGLYQQEKVYQWEKDSLTVELRANETWANASLGDGPFDLVQDLNMIEVILFGRKAVVLGPNNVYQWPRSETKTVALGQTAVPGGTNPGSGGNTTLPPPNSGTENAGNPPPPPPSSPALPANCVPVNPAGGDGLRPVSTGGGTPPPPGGDTTVPSPDNANTDLMCREPGLTFRPFQPGGGTTPGNPPTPPGSPSPSDGGNNGGCPPGARPLNPGERFQGFGGRSQGAALNNGTLPSPFIGGVLKPLPPNPRPFCPPPGIEFEMQYPGGKTEKICLPWDTCADYNDVREALGLSGAEAEAIESAFCAKIETVNRPTTTYPPQEDCISCFVERIVDTLTTVNDKGVTPQVNPMTSFETSSKFGAPIFFNVTMFVKKLAKVPFPPKGKTPAEITEDIVGIQKDTVDSKASDVKQGSAGDSVSASELAQKQATIEKEKKQEYFDKLKAMRFGTSGQGLAQYWQTIDTGLNKLKDHFSNINDQLGTIPSILNFDTVYQCKAK